MIDFSLKIPLRAKKNPLLDLFIKVPIIKLTISNEDIELIAWGDPIYTSEIMNSSNTIRSVNDILKQISGHYYFVFENKILDTTYIGNSMFSILPIYYNSDGQELFCSNSPLSCSPNKQKGYNKSFLLENILFNYQIFNHSVIKDVELLAANSFILINNGVVNVVKHTAIESLFTSNPKAWRKSVDEISDLFLQSSQKYFPDEPYITSLTGGFDGRTLVSAGLYNNKKFSTYCFGSELSEDVKIARDLCNLSSLEYNKIALDENYMRNESLTNGLEFILNSAGGGGFSRSHYLYACKELSSQTKYIITGNLGSEIFRAVHTSGSVVSPNLYNLFTAKDYDTGIKNLSKAKEWNWIKRSEFKNEWECLEEELKQLTCFSFEDKNLTKNQQLYKFVFEEVFRKYFGAEMVNQYKYLVNRTPFIDFKFIEGLLKTELAGVYSDMFTQNPFKRFKGQVLYAHIIKKAYPNFSIQMTDKGYRPEDLLSVWGNLKIGKSFINKKIHNNKLDENDNYSVNSSFRTNLTFWQNIGLNESLFNVKAFENGLNNFPSNRNSLFIALSQAWYNGYIIKQIR